MALVSLICAVALTGALLSRRGGVPLEVPRTGSRLTAVYLPILVVQWSLALYVCRIGRPRSALRSLLGEHWGSVDRLGTDVALALSGWVLINAFELAWSHVFGAGGGASIVAMLPRSWPERASWLVVSLSVGFCEELVYRGYLQTQLTAFTGRATLGTVIQAVLFGVAHLDQGSGAVAKLALYGLALGALARWRRTLRPCILCHVATDLASGLFR